MPKVADRNDDIGTAGLAAKLSQDLHPIRRRPGTSLHHQVSLVLRDRILNGHYEAGALMPSEDDLSRLFGVSRVTIRAALASLDRENLVERRQGVGTFVAARVRAARLHAPVTDLMAQIAEIDRNTNVELIEFDYVVAPEAVQTVFGCDRATIFQRAVRVRRKGPKPIFHITTFVPQGVAKHFSRELLETKTLFRLLSESGVQIDSGTQIVSAVLADPLIAPLLDVAVGAPLLELRRQYRDQGGSLIGYVTILASPAQFEVHLSLDTAGMQRPN